MRRIMASALLGSAMLLAGCGLIPGVGTDPRIDASPVAQVACPETYEADYAEAGLVPDGFTAVAVLRCDPYASQEDADGTWSGALLERREGDLRPVLAALAQPSDSPSTGPCPAIAYLIPELWIEGEDGTVVRVAIPTDGCGAPKPVGLDEALEALDVAEETFFPTALVESNSANMAGCDTQAQFLVIAGLDDIDLGTEQLPSGSKPLPEDALIPMAVPAWPDADAITGARLCDYTAESSAQSTSGTDTTTFVGVRELDADAAQDLTALARTAPADARSCTATATAVVVVHLEHTGGEVAATVELDGCTRLIDPSMRARTAPAELLTLLTPIT
ncbi:hypothetical protein [Microbacterium saperdae]|uniref:Uncharacterized protein n=1 Tax=Microbacterium saperdae TaxID=69368 RepID=A0A543BLY0_9MICO|nr:hypothetical protein [Microbacterium saperdae]TQL85832.1 hypothetical protein FB560_1466 [Microbacterium saperdae]GGM52707.1 hypothetical protein GCM10010489_25320 [Microbacterium saperdae]